MNKTYALLVIFFSSKKHNMPLYIYLHSVGISNCITDKNESREEKRVQRVSELQWKIKSYMPCRLTTKLLYKFGDNRRHPSHSVHSRSSSSLNRIMWSVKDEMVLLQSFWSVKSIGTRNFSWQFLGYSNVQLISEMVTLIQFPSIFNLISNHNFVVFYLLGSGYG